MKYSRLDKKNEFIEDFLGEINLSPKITDLKDIYFFPFTNIQSYSLTNILKYWQDFFADVSGQDFVYYLYLHIPFCQHRCSCCNYFLQSAGNVKNRYAFLRYLAKQVQFLAPHFTNKVINSLFLGGGSPSSLTSRELNFLLKLIFKNFLFNKDTYKTFEANPNDLDEQKLSILKKYNFNKISLGVQTFDKDVQLSINRGYQDYQVVKKNIALIKGNDFGEINIDLLIGLSGETVDTFFQTLEKTLLLEPTTITLYSLTPTDFYLKQAFGDSKELFYEKYYHLIEGIGPKIKFFLQKQRYFFEGSLDKLLTAEVEIKPIRKIKVKSFSYTGTNDFSQQKRVLLGLGPSARSNIYGHLNYEQAPVITKKFDVDSLDYHGHVLDLKDEMIRFVIVNICENQLINLAKFKNTFGMNFEAIFKDEVDFLFDAKRLSRSADSLIFNYDSLAQLFKSVLLFIDEDKLHNVLTMFKRNV